MIMRMKMKAMEGIYNPKMYCEIQITLELDVICIPSVLTVQR
jgi:hypothetical protein